ncbi:hypothetical protein M2G57_20445 [Vibrio vulnificus]|nr:hypothetical protein [Vibrio vulnificus]MCU8447980.1 hypothetical protein [Vibrio vulnificus]
MKSVCGKLICAAFTP